MYQSYYVKSELDQILMDVEMPCMNGLTASRKIRRYQNLGEVVSHVPIIAVTANARSEQIETAIAAGMVGDSSPRHNG